MAAKPKKEKGPDGSLLAGMAVFAAAIGGTAYALASLGISPLWSALLTMAAGVCGLGVSQAIGSSRWQQEIAKDVESFKYRYDRLVREVARNRNDISALKKGLGDIAANLTEQGKRHGPSATVEARLIDTLVSRLSALGNRPRAALKDGSARSRILELQMIPPPANPAPASRLDREMGADDGPYSESAIRKFIRRAIVNDNIAVFLQPVVRLPQRKTEMFEVYARIPAARGSWLPAARYMDIAAKEALAPAIDNQLLLRCLQMLPVKDGQTTPGPAYILNVTGTTLKDRGFMSDLIAYLSQNRQAATRLVFELPQGDIEKADTELAKIMQGLSRLGCRFSMDRIRQRRLDINKLRSRHIRFLKLDAAWLLQESRLKNGFAAVMRLKKELDAAGIDLIVEKIESEALLKELFDFNIDYGQGYLFGKPDLAAAWPETKKVA